ncbi:MAG: SRPBCC domain-containing protein [Anaerolineales bacterium]|nr:MAG: SRPBCC domain-containing protein [Anaerolineales bacterium]
MSTERKFKISFPSDTEMVMEREFDAPRELVFDAHLNPEAIPQWWGGRGDSTEVVEMDVRAGGKWRFITRTKDEQEFVFFGEYREITPPERFIRTFGFEAPAALGIAMPGEPGEETYSFIDLGNDRTLLRVHSFTTREEFEGMEEGANENYDKLDEFLAQKTAA